MLRILKPETTIRKQMQSFIDANGISEENKVTGDDGSIVYVMPPNRFGSGYIRLITTTGENWAADLGDKALYPKRNTYLENLSK